MTNGFSVDPGELAAHEQALRRAAAEVGRLHAPDPPRAGGASFEIADVIGHLATAIESAGEQLTTLASAFAEAARSYDDVDDTIALLMGRW